MRPDKKGKRKPHPGQGASGKAPPKGPPPKDTSRAVPPQPSVPPVPPPTAKPADTTGPRVLEPATPVDPPSSQDKYRRREIRSNWARYELPAEPELEPGEDYRVGDTFDELLAAAGADAGYFTLRSERSWLEDSGKTPELLSLDVTRLAAVLQRLPLHKRLDIDTKHFTEEELSDQLSEAEQLSSASLGVPPPLQEREKTREAVLQRTLDLLRDDTPPEGVIRAEQSAAGEGEKAAVSVKENGVASVLSFTPLPPVAHSGDTPTTTALSPAVATSATTASPITAEPAAAAAEVVSAAAAATAEVVSAAAVSPVSPATPDSVVKTLASVSAAPLLDEDWLDSVLSDED